MKFWLVQGRKIYFRRHQNLWHTKRNFRIAYQMGREQISHNSVRAVLMQMKTNRPRCFHNREVKVIKDFYQVSLLVLELNNEVIMPL